MKIFLFILFNFLSIGCLLSQESLQARLGYGEEEKLLIIHADDLGVSHAQNKGSFESMTRGVVNSGSIMMPCPWVAEVVEFYKEHPDSDLGLHLTLTNEWKKLRWSSVAPNDQVSSILNEDGFMYPDCLEFGKHAKLEDVEKELRAQIDKSLALGLKPTHLDAHMGCLVFSSAEIFGIYLKLGREYKIPCMVSRFFLKAAGQNFLDQVTDQDVIIERTFTAGPDDFDGGMEQYYEDVLRNRVLPGVQILLIHPGYDNEEMKAMTEGHYYWGSAWRQQDLEFFTSNKCRKILQEENIKLIRWSEIQKLY